MKFILENEGITICFDSMDDFKGFLGTKNVAVERYHYIVKMQYSSLSQIEILDSMRYINADFIFCNIGNKVKVLSMAEELKNTSIRIYLHADDETNISSLKLLASLGINCGLWIDEDSHLNDDDFIELASYYFMSPANPASIEPFSYIISHINDDNNISVDNLYARGMNTFIHDEDKKLVNATTQKILQTEDLTEEIIYNETTEAKMNDYYSHFMNLDRCSKCKAFRICSGSFANKLSKCEETLSEIIDYIMLTPSMVQNNNL